MTEKDNKNTRVIFLDNLRVFFVLCVVLQHAANGYIGLDWWPVSEADVSIVANGLGAFFDAFTMPLLFYIAGYFAVPVIGKKGTARFIAGKLKRLGLPLILVSLCICPILPFVYHYTRNDCTMVTGYWEMTLDLFHHAAQFNVGLIPSMNHLMMSNQFYQRYMWFLSLLIFFFLVFAAVYHLKPSWFQRVSKSSERKPRSALSTVGLFLTVAVSTSILSFCVVGAMFALTPGLTNPEPLFTLGNIIQFRPSRFPLFVFYFIFGILTYRNRLIERGRFPGHSNTWLACVGILLVPFLIAHYQVRFGSDNTREMSGALFFLLSNFMAISSLGLFTSLAMRYGNRPTPVSQILAANSFQLYLTHYPFVIAFQLLFLGWTGVPVLIKFVLVSLLSTGMALVVSHYVVRPHPRITAVICIALFVGMAVTLRT